MSEHPHQFDCIECRRRIIRFCGYDGEPDICGACMTVPGWFRDPMLRAMLDAEHDGSDPADEACAQMKG